MNREYSMRFTYRPYTAEGKEQVFRHSLLNRQQPATGLIEGFGKSKVDGANLPRFETDNDNLLVSAFKMTHNRQGVLVRIFNPTPVLQTGSFSCEGASYLIPCGLNEIELDDAEVVKPKNGQLSIVVPQYGLRSFIIE